MASTMSFAQLSSIGFGVKGGVNVSTMNQKFDGKEIFDDADARIGFHAGVFLNIPLMGNLSVQPEVIYNNVGNKYEKEFDLPIIGKRKVGVKNNLDYVAVPVMLQYDIAQGLYLEAGPQFSFLLDQKNKFEGIDKDRIEDLGTAFVNLLHDKNDYKGFDLGLGVGAGYKLYKNIGINARYIVGLSNNSKLKDFDIKNNTFQAGITLGF